MQRRQQRASVRVKDLDSVFVCVCVCFCALLLILILILIRLQHVCTCQNVSRAKEKSQCLITSTLSPKVNLTLPRPNFPLLMLSHIHINHTLLCSLRQFVKLRSLAVININLTAISTAKIVNNVLPESKSINLSTCRIRIAKFTPVPTPEINTLKMTYDLTFVPSLLGRIQPTNE